VGRDTAISGAILETAYVGYLARRDRLEEASRFDRIARAAIPATRSWWCSSRRSAELDAGRLRLD